MYVDSLLALSGSISGNTVTGQNVFSAGTTVTSTNNIDLASGGIPTGQVRDLGGGTDYARLRVEVVTAFSGGTSCTFNIVTADDAAITTNVTVIGSTGAIAIASLTAGARFEAEINTRIGSKGQRYVAMQAVMSGTSTAGAVYADIGPDIEDAKYYPSGFAVS
jgi:hypothetical protein